MMRNDVEFPISKPRVTLAFGAVFAPWYTVERPHKGVDLSPWPGARGEPIAAPIRGSIASIDTTDRGGLVVTLEGSAPTGFSAREWPDLELVQVPAGAPLRWRFAHLARADVMAGDPVRAGTPIGAIGDTGSASTGPHLHLELYALVRGSWLLVDPMGFLEAGIAGLSDRVVYA